MDMTYAYSKVNEAINNRNSAHVELALVQGGYIDRMLEKGKNSPYFDEIASELEKVRKYLSRHPERLRTKREVRKSADKAYKLIRDSEV